MTDAQITAFRALFDVCEEYLAELASPAPDYMYRQVLRRRMADRLAAFKETSEAPAAQPEGMVKILLRCRVCGAPATIIQEERIPPTGEARHTLRTGWCDVHFPGVEGGK